MQPVNQPKIPSPKYEENAIGLWVDPNLNSIIDSPTKEAPTKPVYTMTDLEDNELLVRKLYVPDPP